MIRRRGGQPGNRNALRHGFYSGSFQQKEAELLSSGGGVDFDDEIELVRILIKRTMDKAKEQDDLTLDENLSLLRTVSFAAMVVERLSRARQFNRAEGQGESLDGG